MADAATQQPYVSSPKAPTASNQRTPSQSSNASQYQSFPMLPTSALPNRSVNTSMSSPDFNAMARNPSANASAQSPGLPPNRSSSIMFSPGGNAPIVPQPSTSFPLGRVESMGSFVNSAAASASGQKMDLSEPRMFPGIVSKRSRGETAGSNVRDGSESQE
jgi:hypothetical protein